MAVAAFAASTSLGISRSSFTPTLSGNGRVSRCLSPHHLPVRSRARVTMFFGPGGGGFLGVGPLEAGVVLVVAWVVLGPQEMLKLARDTGKLIGRARVWAADTQASLRETADLDNVEREIRETVEAVRAPIEAVRAPRVKKQPVQEENETSEKETEKEDSKKVQVEGTGEKISADELTQVDRTAAHTPFQEQMARLEDPDQVSPWENGSIAAAKVPMVNDIPQSLSVKDSPERVATTDDNGLEEDEELRQLEETYRTRRKALLRKKLAALDKDMHESDTK